MIGADNRRQMKLQVIGKRTEHRRALLPDTVGKNSLFVKMIMEHYGQGEGYRFDAASMVYLLPAALPDTEEEKKEPEEEKALAYILRERETVKQTAQIERNREFVVRIMEKTVLPAGVETLHRASERKQTEKLLQRLLKDYQYIRLTEMREFLRETEKKIRSAAPESGARGASSDGKYLRAEKAVQQKAAKLIAGLAALPAEKKVRERRAVSRELVRLFLSGEEGEETFLPAQDEESGPKLQELPSVLREVSAEMDGLLQRMERQDTEGSGLLPDDADRMLERGTETLQKAETILTLLETERLLKESGKVPESREHPMRECEADRDSREYPIRESEADRDSWKFPQEENGGQTESQGRPPKEARIQPEVLQLEANVERLLVYHERRIGRELEEQAFFHEIRQMLDFHEWETSKTSGPTLMLQRLDRLQKRRKSAETAEAALYRELETLLVRYEQEPGRETEETKITAGGTELHTFLREMRSLLERQESVEIKEAGQTALYHDLETLLVRYEQGRTKETNEIKETVRGMETRTILQEVRRLLERQESVESTASERSTLYRDLETLLVRYEQGQDKERNEIKETVREIEMSTVLQEVRRLLERQESVESTVSERSSLYRELETLLVRYEQEPGRETEETKITAGGTELRTFLQEMRSLLERQESVESKETERGTLYHDLETLLVRYEQGRYKETNEIKTTEETKITAGGTESRTFLREMRSLLERQESVESKETERGTLYHDLETLLVRYEQGQAKETKATKETVREIEMRTILQEVRSLLERQESVESTASERSTLYRDLKTFLVRYEQERAKEANEIKETVREIETRTILQEVRNLLERQKSVESVVPERRSLNRELDTLLVRYEQELGRETEETKITVSGTELHTFLRELRSLLEGQESVGSTVSGRGTLYHDLETLLVRYEQGQAKETKATKEIVREIETRTVLQGVRSLLEQQESVESMGTERSTLYHDLETLLVRYEQGRARETNKIKETVRETATCTILQEVRSLLERQESVESAVPGRSSLYRELETLLVRYEQGFGKETEETKITVSKAEPRIFLREMRNLLERQESVENKESDQDALYHDLETLLVRYEQGQDKETNGIKETVHEIETRTVLKEVRSLLERQKFVESTASKRSTLYRDLETLLVRYEQESERETEETKITAGGTETRTFLREVRSLLERQEFAESTASGHSTLYRDLEQLLIPREPTPGNPLPEEMMDLMPPDLRTLSETAWLVQEHKTKTEAESAPGLGEEKAVSAEVYGGQERQLRELQAQTSRQEKKLKQMEEWKQDVLRKMEEEKEPPAEQKRAVYLQFQERLRLERMRRGFS